MDSSLPLKVFKLSKFEDLSNLLYPHEYSSLYASDNSHCFYFWHDYLGPNGLNATFALVESNYISKDYLDGYRQYYITCFNPPERNCTRLHFFSTNQVSKQKFENQLKNAIINDDPKFWAEEYLGFIVVKPLPQFNIGFTALRHYNYNSDKRTLHKSTRIFWGTKEYTFNIFGHQIKIDTLAFQEQDTNLAACASIAIWAMLQIPSDKNFIKLKSPGEITNDADLIADDGNRLFPNNGLILNQMCTAITKSGLATEIEQLDTVLEDGLLYRYNPLWLKLLVNAYSTLKIPIILLMEVPEGISDDLKFEGHAVAICGHEEELENNLTDRNDIISYAERIKKLYVHDDGFGPFARMEFRDDGMASAWGSDLKTGKYENKPCLPRSLIISVYPEIKVRYKDIDDTLLFQHFLLTFVLSDDLRPVWDTKIRTHEEWKSLFREKTKKYSCEDAQDFKLKVLTTPLPKYIWIATCYINNIPIVEFIFDTSGMRNSMLLLNILFYDFEVKETFKSFILDKEIYEIIKDTDITQDGCNLQYLHFLKQYFTPTKNEKKNLFWENTPLNFRAQ